jgi:hypothetical protein
VLPKSQIISSTKDFVSAKEPTIVTKRAIPIGYGRTPEYTWRGVMPYTGGPHKGNALNLLKLRFLEAADSNKSEFYPM